MTGFEPVTFSLPRKRSTPELHRLLFRAGDGTRTRDIQLGRLTLYQLSYSRSLAESPPAARLPVWWGEDSNLRSITQQIYSLPPLATREPHPVSPLYQ